MLIKLLNRQFLNNNIINFNIKKMALSTTIVNTTKTNVTNEKIHNNLVAICQMRSTNNKHENRLQIKEIIERSIKQNAKFIFLPELCDFVGGNRQETLALAETIDGENVQYYRQLAKEYDVWLSIGGIQEAVPILSQEADQSQNLIKFDKLQITHMLINNMGNIIGKYSKIHLFDVDTPTFKFKESALVVCGRRIIPPIQTPIGQLGLMICYDLRFPEISTILYRAGAQILTYPSAFQYETGKAHWETLLRARAIETQCFVIASAQCGYHNEKRQSYGHAMVVDPWGKIIGQCQPDKELDVAVAAIDLNHLITVRENMPCLQHRRNDIYQLTAYNMEFKQFNEMLPNEPFYFETNLIPNETIFYQTAKSVAFTNIRCVVRGHVLVATRRKARYLKDLEQVEIIDFFRTVCKLQKMLEQFYGVTSSTITIQDGEHAGQSVKHVHCHIMPRREGDFKINDEIYTELHKHDRDESKPRRSLQKQISEAEKYKQFLEDYGNDGNHKNENSVDNISKL